MAVRFRYTVVLFTVSILLGGGLTWADKPTAPVGPKLPPKVRDLLLQEMNAVSGATHEILDALIRGEGQIVAERAQAIHDSFILKQEMTEEDRRALVKAVPDDFVQRDRAFHQLAGDLAAAARKRDSQHQQALFADMVEACRTCHARYATNQFPSFPE